MPSSMTRLVEASRKARAGTRPAPFWNRARLVLRAAKLHELERKPKKVPRATDSGPVVPMARRMRSSVTNTWIIELMA